MKLPLIGEIASTNISKIDIKDTLLSMMEAVCNDDTHINDDFRRIILVSDDGYHLLSVYDVLSINVDLLDPSKPIETVITPPPPAFLR